MEAREVEKLYLLAEGGDASAQCELGFMYLDNTVFEKIPEIAAKWFRASSAQKNEKAARKLMEMYKAGTVEETGNPTRLELTEILANLGDSDCQMELVKAYLDDPSKAAEAVAMLQKSAEGGNAEASLKYGTMLEDGKGVAKDVSKAYEYYETAAKAGFPEACERLGYAWLNGIHPAANGEKDYIKARDYFDTSKEANMPISFFGLSQIYAQGLGVDKDEEMADKYLEKASSLGLPLACAMYGNILMRKNAVNSSEARRGAKLIEKAAEAKVPSAVVQLSNLLAHGYNIDKDSERAIAMAEEVNNDGSLKSKLNLAGVYLACGKETEAFDMVKAEEETGDPEVLYFIGYCLVTGKGADKNLKLAKDYLTKSSKAGNERAKNMIKELF